MRWEDQRRSGNVEDRRGMRVPGGVAGGGIGTIVIVLLVSAGSPARTRSTLFQMAGWPAARRRPSRKADRRADRRSAGRVRRGRCSASTEDAWSRVFQQAGQRYRAAYAGAVQRRRAVGVRHQFGGGRAVLLPGRPEGLHRPRILPRARSEVRRARRFRAGLRDRSRGGPPPADAARRLRAGHGGPPAWR